MRATFGLTEWVNEFAVRCGRDAVLLGYAILQPASGGGVAPILSIGLDYTRHTDSTGVYWRIPESTQWSMHRGLSPVAHLRTGGGQRHMPPAKRGQRPIRRREFDPLNDPAHEVVRLGCPVCRAVNLVVLDTALTSRYTESI